MSTSRPTNRELLLPYALPYAAYVLMASVPPDVLGRAANYAVRIGLTAAALLWARRRLVRLTGPRPVAGSLAVGLAAGLLGTALWIGLVLPFVPDTGQPWTCLDFALRLAAAVLFVPLFEELLLRGYLLRFVVQWGDARRAGVPHALAITLDERRIDDVAAGAWSVAAVVLSTVLFALGHAPHEWVASVAYGALMAALWIVRQDLLTCLVAHAVTNLALGLVVWTGGLWQVW